MWRPKNWSNPYNPKVSLSTWQGHEAFEAGADAMLRALAEQNITRSKAVRLGMVLARAKGKNVGRPVVIDSMDADLVVRLRNEGKSWQKITDTHPPIQLPRGKVIKPSMSSIRRLFANKEAENVET